MGAYENHKEVHNVLDKAWVGLWDHSFDSLLVVDCAGKVKDANAKAKVLERKLAAVGLEQPLEQLMVQLGLDCDTVQKNREISFYGQYFKVNVVPLKKQLQLVIMKNLNEIKEVQEKAEQTEETNKELQDIINLSADGLVSVDGNGVLLRMNEAYEKIVGIRSDDFVGKPASLLKQQGYLPDIVSRHVMEDLKPKSLVFNIRGKDVLLTGRPVFNDKGKLIRIVANIRDLSQLNRLKDEINKYSQLTSRYETELQRFRAKEFADDFVADSAKMKELIELTIQAAQVEANVLVYGESGTGKEMVAKMIHKSSRKEGAFIAVNCGALPGNLLESELFGYQGGAFTGADKNGKIGLFEAADGGTLFLDEIGDMPLEMQVKLLRAIQEKKIRRVGSNEEIRVDVRLVAATNKDLKPRVEAGMFREDLFYRLNVIKLHVTPLRERKEDIPGLVDHFLRNLSKKYGMKRQITKGMMAKLMGYDWPGNVRELENTIERLVVLSKGLNLEFELLGEEILSTTSAAFPADKPLKKVLADAEKEIILKVYQECGSTRKAAKQLGVSQATVARKLQKYSTYSP